MTHNAVPNINTNAAYGESKIKELSGFIDPSAFKLHSTIHATASAGRS